MAITQLFAVFQKNIVISEETANNIRQLRLKYIEYLDKLELLYLDIHDKKLSIDEIKERYYKIREFDLLIENLKDCLNIKKLKRPSKRGEREALIRLSKKYNIIIPPMSQGRMKKLLSALKTKLLKLLKREE